MSKIIKKLKEIHLLIFLKMVPDMVSEYWDFTRETVRCGLSRSKTKQLTEILMLTHAIEKGFSLKDVRVGFGVEKMKSLVAMIELYVGKYGYDESLQVPISLVFAYQQFKEDHQCATEELNRLFERIEKLVSRLGKKKSEFSSAGTLIIKQSDVSNLSKTDFSTLAVKRHAIRNFGEKVGEASLKKCVEEAIEVAKYAPSACNRQSYRVHIYSGEEKTRLLKEQGSTAFCEDAEMAIIVTGDMNRYYSFEQHLMYVDASLFAMSLMYALTAKGIANIPLTQCIRRKTLNLIRKDFVIPKNEMPVIMLAIGYYPEEVKVACSERMKYTAFTTFH